MSRLESLMKDHFIEYASYFILDRAIPDLRDGLKPVQRRILHTLFRMNDGRFHKVANVIGDTMNGPLYLAGDPTGPLEAATKDYVDTHSGGGGTGGLDEATANDLYVNIIGDTISGPLFLPADPTGPLEVPTKQYVDARIWYGSQAEYDAILTKNPTVLYCIGV